MRACVGGARPQEGRWAIFNDEKVAASEKPPRELGYLYLFRRVLGTGF